MQHFPFLMLAQATGGGRGVGGGEGSNAAVIFLHLLLFLIKHSFSPDNGFGSLSRWVGAWEVRWARSLIGHRLYRTTASVFLRPLTT